VTPLYRKFRLQLSFTYFNVAVLPQSVKTEILMDIFLKRCCADRSKFAKTFGYAKINCTKNLKKTATISSIFLSILHTFNKIMFPIGTRVKLKSQRLGEFN
jgi:hypothetical protein